MTVWFTADTHFGSQRTLELSRRPFKDTHTMDNDIFSWWIALFEPGDVLYHLGDFGEFERAMGWLKYKGVTCHLILGNYEEDAISSGEYTREDLLDMGFASVNNSLHIPELDGIFAVHRPEDCDKRPGAFNIFGHIHGRQTVKRYGLDVGVDAHHFRPVSADDVFWYKNAIENHYDENVFD